MERARSRSPRAAPAPDAGSVVCVTGATGYIAAHIVKQLLERGHRVRGTVRSLASREKLAPLVALPGASERLKLVEADMMKPEGFAAMLDGVTSLIHTATPIEIPLDGTVPVSTMQEAQEKQIAPAVDGTAALLRAASSAGVQKVVLTSSIAAMRFTSTPPAVLSEECWSDESFMRDRLFTMGPACYALAKTLQERKAWSLSKELGFKLVVINPALVIGPSMTPHLNFSLEALLGLVKGGGTGLDPCKPGTLPDGYKGWVDVREVSEAHVLALESESAEGRYLLQSCFSHYADVAKMMRAHPALQGLPELPVDSPDGSRQAVEPKRDNSKMTQLGVAAIPLAQSVSESLDSLDPKLLRKQLGLA